MPSVAYQHYTLEYPPWALDFDPYNRGYLVVGGGGGQDQKEVPNKITLLDVSNRATITKVAELDVKDDSPFSLGLLAAKDGIFMLAGINSTSQDTKSGKNEHLRSYKATFPIKSQEKQGAGAIAALSKNQLFSKNYSTSRDAFQRLLRLSPAQIRATGNKRIGAIASSFSSKSEIVIFDATVASPTPNDIIARIEPLNNAEANDIDIWETAPENFIVSYCTATAVYQVPISFDFATRKLKTKTPDPVCLHEILSRPAKLRSLRFISENHILLVLNRGSESELLVLRTHHKGGPGDVVLRRRLSKKVRSAVSMDVSSLDSDATTGEKQVVVAVAAQSKNISIFTIDVPGKGSPKAIKTFLELKDVHDASMKKVVLSSFYPPHATANTSTNAKKPKKEVEQYLRLASISLSNTLIVESIPLQTIETKSKNPRYVLDNAGVISRAIGASSNLFVFAFILLSMILIAQSYLDAQAAQGHMKPYNLIPVQIRQFVSQARIDNDPIKHIIEETVAADGSAGRRIADLINLHPGDNSAATEKKKAIIVRTGGEGELAAEVDSHKSADADPSAKRWDELSKKQQDNWKQKLVKAGQWSVDEGETVLKGIFFSEVAGAIGRAAMEAMAN